MADGACMPKFSGEAVRAVEDLTIDDDSGAYAGPKGNHDKVFHPLCDSVSHLADSSSVGIIGKRYRNAAEGLGKHFRELHRTVGSPGKIRCKCNRTGIIVSIRCAYTYSPDTAFHVGLSDKILYGLGNLRNDYFGRRIVAGLYYFLGKDFATGIDDAELYSLSTNVYTNNMVFFM